MQFIFSPSHHAGDKAERVPLIEPATENHSCHESGEQHQRHLEHVAAADCDVEQPYVGQHLRA
jgi:hypothetical protein